MASTVTREMQDQFLSTVRKSQEIALDAIKTMVGTIQNITPKVPSVSMPFADRLPKPEDVVAGSYDFAEQLLTSQRKFADEVVKAAAPLMPGKAEAPPSKPGSCPRQARRQAQAGPSQAQARASQAEPKRD